jgi:PKHD-type hydroxylase
MIWLLNDVLTPAESGNILSVYTEHRFHCGSDSNRRANVKKSLALNYDDPDYKRCTETLYVPLQKALSDYLIRRSGQPYFSWYKTGGFYDWHLDAFPIAGIAPHFSYTVALNDPDEYEGGELVIRVGNTESSFKPPKGSAILYNTGLWHKVNEVTSGDRKVAIGWAESYIKESAIRQNIIDLKLAINDVADDITHAQLEKLESARINMIREFVDRP